MRPNPDSLPLLRPVLLTTVLLLLAGCESLYEGPTRTARDSSARSDRYAMRDRGRSDYGARYDASTAAADSSSDRAERAADRSRASSGARTGSSAAGGTRVQRDGDRTRYTMAYPTGDRDSSVMIVEKTVPSQVRLNQPFDYEIKVTNITDATLDDVRIQEQTPEGLAITAAEPQRKGEGASAAWELGTLRPRETRTIKVSGKADRQGELGTCVFASYKPSLCAALNVVNPQIRVTKIAPQQADICDDIEYRYTVTNTGTGVADHVTVREDLPEGLTTQDGRNQVVLDAGRLEAGQTKEGVARLKAARAGSFQGRAVATASDGLQAQTEPAAVRITQPKLGVKVEAPESDYVDRPIAYRVTVTNEGDSSARDATVAVNIPTATRVANVGTQGRADRTGIRWDLGTLEPRASKTVTFNLSGTEAAAALETTARARARCAAEVSGSARTKVMTIAALLLEAVDLADPVRVGENVVYRITVTNQGSGPDTNVRVTAKLPAELQYVSATGPTEATADGQTVKFAPVTTLAPGRSARWELTATAKQAGDVRFDVQLESDSLTKPGSKSEPTRLY